MGPDQTMQFDNFAKIPMEETKENDETLFRT